MSRSLPRLDRVEALHVRVPFRQPFVTATGVSTLRSSWILRLRDVDGNEGFGEIALDPAAAQADELAISQAVREAVAVVGAGGLPGEDALAKLGALGRALCAGIDEALEQLEALGGAATDPTAGPAAGRSSVAVNATVHVSDAREAAETAARAVASGFSCLKLKVGAETQNDLVERVQAVRAAVGSSVRLRLDVNAGWDLSAAVQRLNALAALDIEYVEQPLVPTDVDGHATLRRASPVPIALDESVESESAVARILAAGAADVLVTKPARVGGPSAVRAIAARSADAGVPVVISTFFETGIGLYAALRAAAALPTDDRDLAHGLATADILVHDLLATPIAVAGGRITVPSCLVPDEQAIEFFTVEKAGPIP
jgi:o-succinylbenzoate synthase